MNLKEILSISGYSGLFKFLAQGKNGILVEGLEDHKKMNAYSNYKVSSLEDISVFCESGDVPLKKILLRIAEKESNQPVQNLNSDNKLIKSYFESLVPDYDREKVYVSDMKKIVSWYNILLKNDLLSLCEENADETSTQEEEKENQEEAKTN